MPARWTDAQLDRLRTVADEPADRAVRAFFNASPDSAQWNRLHALLDSFVSDSAAPPPGLPPELIDYLTTTARVPPPSLPRISAGEALFADLGPEILLVLGCYSLPAAYAAAKGAQVLCRTEFLERAAQLRLFQTAQMIVDVMSPGGLGPRGTGIRAAQKVRLLHASIRHLIRTDASNPWNADLLGVPINQEDLAGTLMTFTLVVLDGLAKLDITVPREQQEAYYDAWRAVASLMGLVDELIPATLEEARELMTVIHRRQIAASPEGVRLTQSLLQALSEGPFAAEAAGAPASWLSRLANGAIEHEMKQISSVLMRHMLDGQADRNGTPVADLLQLPPAPMFSEFLLDVALRIGAAIEHDLNDTAHRRRVLRWFNIRLIDWMLTRQLGAGRSLFSVPDSLYASWKHT